MERALNTVASIRVWAKPFFTKGRVFVPELSTVTEESANAALNRSRTFLQHQEFDGRIRYATATLWTVPVAAVSNPEFQTWLQSYRYPKDSTLHLISASHYLSCGHSGIDNVLQDLVGTTPSVEVREQVRLDHHVWSGEVEFGHKLTLNIVSELGVKVNKKKKLSTDVIPPIVPALYAIMTGMKENGKSVNVDTRIKHFDSEIPAYAIRHPSAFGNIMEDINYRLSLMKETPSNKFKFKNREWWDSARYDFQLAVRMIVKDEIYSRELYDAASRLFTNLSILIDSADVKDKMIDPSEELIALFQQVYDDMRLWREFVSPRIKSEPYYPVSPYKMFDVMIFSAQMIDI